MQALAYRNDIVEKQSLYRLCPSTLHKVSKKDYPQDDFFKEEIACLDMDAYEHSLRGIAQPTVDAVIGVSKPNSIEPFLMLIELKMNCRGYSDLSSENCAEKISHSQELLIGGCPIWSSQLFIFRDKVINRMRSKMRSLRNEDKRLKNLETLSVKEFEDNVKRPESYPPVYENNYDAISRELIAHIQNEELQMFFNSFEYWLRKMDDYQNKNKLKECQKLKEILISVWSYLKEQNLEMGDDDTLEAEIIEEDYGWLLNKQFHIKTLQ